jgi:hypothetical protein
MPSWRRRASGLVRPIVAADRRRRDRRQPAWQAAAVAVAALARRAHRPAGGAGAAQIVLDIDSAGLNPTEDAALMDALRHAGERVICGVSAAGTR